MNILKGVHHIVQIKFHKRAVKFINSRTASERKLIKQAIYDLVNNSASCDIKPLQGYKELYRLRVGNYCIIYTKDNFILFIADIGNRGDIYKKY